MILKIKIKVVSTITIKELRESTGLSQSKFAEKFHIPIGTLQHWEQGVRKPPEYVIYMIEVLIDNDYN